MFWAVENSKAEGYDNWIRVEGLSWLFNTKSHLPLFAAISKAQAILKALSFFVLSFW